MAYIYKIISDTELELAKKGIISLSHPIFEFKGSEGTFINFAKRIYDKYKRQGLKIKPSSRDLEDIKDWIDAFEKTYGIEFKKEDINSESSIIFCGIMQGYCGYFTNENLDDKEVRDNFLKLNCLKNKTAYIKIDKDILKKQWHSNFLDEPFLASTSEETYLQGYNGFLHSNDVIYDENYKDYLHILEKYNNDQIRSSKYWFIILSDVYSYQKEHRLIFLLNSLEKNSCRIACDRKYKLEIKNSWEKLVYENIVNAIDYCCNKGPRFIKLNVGRDNVKIEKFKNIFDANIVS